MDYKHLWNELKAKIIRAKETHEDENEMYTTMLLSTLGMMIY